MRLADDVPRWDDRRKVLGRSTELHDLLHRRPEASFEDRTDRRDGFEPGKRVASDSIQLLFRHAIGEIFKAQRITDDLFEILLDGLPSDDLDDVAQYEATGDRVIRKLPAWHRLGFRLTVQSTNLFRLAQIADIDQPLCRWNPRSMTQQMSQRDRPFAVLRELGNILGDGIIDMQRTLVVKVVDEHRRYRFGAREEVVEVIRCRQLPGHFRQ